MPPFKEIKIRKVEDVHRGDQIVYDRGAYKHHMIVTKDPTDFRKVSVIHYYNDARRGARAILSGSGKSGVPIAEVRSDTIDISTDVKRGRAYRIDYMYNESFSSDETVRRAKSKLGEGKYSPFTNNCEHFATWCKTDSHESSQVISAGKAAVSEGTKTAIQVTAKTALSGGTKEAIKGGTRVVMTEASNKAFNEFLRLASNPIPGQVFADLRKDAFASLASTSKDPIRDLGIRMSGKSLSELAKANSKQLAQEGTKTVMQDITKTVASEGANSVAGEGLKQVVSEGTKTVMKETAKTVVKEGAKSVAGEGLKQLVSEGTKTVMKETAKTVVSESAKSVAREGAKQVAKEGTRAVMTEASNKAFKETAVRLMSSQLPGQVLADCRNSVMKGVLSGSNDPIRNIGLRIAEERMGELARAYAERLAQEGTKTVIKDTTKTVVSEGTKSVVEEGAKQVVKEGGKTATKEATKTAVKESARSVAREGSKQVAKSGGKSLGKKIIDSQGALGIGLTAAVEVYDYDFYSHTRESKKKLDNGEISQCEFEKQVVTHAVKGVASGTATLVGGTLGQILIPVPVVGGMIGGMAGKAAVWLGGLALGELTN